MSEIQARSTLPPRTWTVLSLIEWSRGYLAERGFEEARLHAELMLAHVLRVSRLQLYLQFDRPLVPEELASYRAIFKRRLSHEPLQYILGETVFMGITVSVGPGVLIPRPETELLVEVALQRLRETVKPQWRVLDVGIGSGSIALAIAHHASNVHVTGVDISEAAVAQCKGNVTRLGINRVEVFHADVFGPGFVHDGFDLVVANPPYISRDEFETLMPEVRLFEPRQALTDEQDGYGFLRRFAPRAMELLLPGGLLLCEIGHGQESRAREIVESAGFCSVTVHPDYAGIPRVIEAHVPLT
jgi:release factor glutamine methyltransferase